MTDTKTSAGELAHKLGALSKQELIEELIGALRRVSELAALRSAPQAGADGGAREGSLRSANAARQKEWDPSDQITLAYRGNELAGEVGEACNVIKKLERERLGIRGSRETTDHLAEELADVVICTDLIAMQAGIDLEAAVRDKFNATSEKYGLQTRLPSLRDPVEHLALSEDDIHTLRCAVENLRSPEKDRPETIEAAWRIASKLETIAKRAAIRGEKK